MALEIIEFRRISVDFHSTVRSRSSDHQDVKLLYEAYQTKRKQIKDRVLMNIRSHCRQRAQQVK